MYIDTIYYIDEQQPMQTLSDHLAVVTTEIEHNEQKKTHAQAHAQKIHSLQFSIGSGGSSSEYNAPVETVKGLSEPDKFGGKNYSLVSNRVGTTRAPLVLLPPHHIDAQRTHIYIYIITIIIIIKCICVMCIRAVDPTR